MHKPALTVILIVLAVSWLVLGKAGYAITNENEDGWMFKQLYGVQLLRKIRIDGQLNFMPAESRKRLVLCFIDYQLSKLSPADVRTLDEYTLNLILGRVSPAEAERHPLSPIFSRMGNPHELNDLSKLIPFCPNDVPEFLKYRDISRRR